LQKVLNTFRPLKAGKPVRAGKKLRSLEFPALAGFTVYHFYGAKTTNSSRLTANTIAKGKREPRN